MSLLGQYMGRKGLITIDFRAFRYGMYVVPAYRTGRPKGTNAVQFTV